MLGNRAATISAGRCVASSTTWPASVRRISSSSDRDTTSRGARSPCGWYPVMKASPWTFRSTAPSPRMASVIRNGGAPGSRSAVGWNWKNSMSMTAAPAWYACATPSPVVTSGFVV